MMTDLRTIETNEISCKKLRFKKPSKIIIYLIIVTWILFVISWL